MSNVCTFEPGIASREGGHVYEDISGTLRANPGDNQMTVCGADMYNQDIYEDVEPTLGANCGVSTGRNGVIYGIDQQGGKGQANFTEDVAPAVLSDSHGTPHTVAYGVTAKGNGDCFINKDTRTALSGGGGMPGQGYPTVLILNDQGGKSINVEKEDVSPTLRAQDHGHPPLIKE